MREGKQNHAKIKYFKYNSHFTSADIFFLNKLINKCNEKKN